MMMGLLVLFIVLVVIFAVLSFAVHHIFFIALVIAAIFLIGHSGLLWSRRG